MRWSIAVRESFAPSPRIGGHAGNLHAQFLEFIVVVGQISKLGRTHEGEIRRVEHKYGALSLEGFVNDGHELAVMVGRVLERLDLGMIKDMESSRDGFCTASHHNSGYLINHIDYNDGIDRLSLWMQIDESQGFEISGGFG